MDKEIEQSPITKKLSDELYSLLDTITKGRKNYYYNNAKPDQNSIPLIISNCSTKNAAISFGLNLIPGPWGLLAIVPELTVVLRNQLIMLYDIAVAYNKEKYITKELLLGILLSAFGSGTLGLITMQGSKVLVKRVSLRVFQKLVAFLAGKITQSALKIFFGKFLPLLGAALLATWTRYMTRKIGNAAIEILSKDIELVNEDEVNEKEKSESILNNIKTETPNNITVEYNKENQHYNLTGYNISKERIISLINLMNIDGSASPNEEEFIRKVISDSNFNDSIKTKFLELLKNKMPIDNQNFKFTINDTSELNAIIIDLVTLAKRDGEIKESEKEYILQIAKELGASEKDVDDLILQ